MVRRRRALVVVATVTVTVLAGCSGGGGLPGPATPPPTEFRVTADGEHAVELRYTGIGSQDLAKFRVLLSGAGPADGTYGLETITDDDGWSDADRYVLNRTTLGLDAPLSVDGLTVELQYDDDGEWRTLLRADPAV